MTGSAVGGLLYVDLKVKIGYTYNLLVLQLKNFIMLYLLPVKAKQSILIYYVEQIVGVKGVQTMEEFYYRFFFLLNIFYFLCLHGAAPWSNSISTVNIYPAAYGGISKITRYAGACYRESSKQILRRSGKKASSDSDVNAEGLHDERFLIDTCA